MRNEWLNPALCEAWNQQIGSLGDAFRSWQIAPLTISVCQSLSQSGVNPSSISLESIFVKRLNRIANYGGKSSKNITFLSEMTCLDFGAGEGYLGRVISSLGAKYIGFDVSPHLVQRGNAINANAGDCDSQLFLLDVEDTSASSVCEIAKFDGQTTGHRMIMFHCLLEHLVDKRSFLRMLLEVAKLWAPTSALYFTTLNPDFFLSVFDEGTGDGQKKVQLGETGFSVSLSTNTLGEVESLLAETGWRLCSNYGFGIGGVPEDEIPDIYKSEDTPYDLKKGPFNAFLAIPSQPDGTIA